MTSLWSSHAGVNYEELLEELPRPIRAACVQHASKEPLDWFVMKNVVTEGSIVRAMYFVTKGHLNMQSNSLLDGAVGLRAGSYFGERGLLGCTISAYTVRTVRACDLFSLSSQDFIHVLQQHSFTRLALELCGRAYQHLKAKNIEKCSKHAMEDHWGAVLLDTVQELQTHQQPATTAGEESSEKELPEGLTPSTRRQSTSERDGHDEISSENSRGNEQLPDNLDAMFKALKTAENCFEAFAPLLHIMLATDPLDWSTSFTG
eukprot:jgi/Phyca11/123729/e_gw1.51.338.1